MEFTENQIAELKAKHGDVFRIKVGGKSCLLRKPTRKEMSYAGSAGQTDPLKFNEMILKNCWLIGDEEIKTDDKLFLGVCNKIADLIEVEEAELEKL